MSVYNELKYNVSFANAGGLVLLSTQTASASASISFTTGITVPIKNTCLYLIIYTQLLIIQHFTFNLAQMVGVVMDVTKHNCFSII
jgi:hypothetical protein